MVATGGVLYWRDNGGLWNLLSLHSTIPCQLSLSLIAPEPSLSVHLPFRSRYAVVELVIVLNEQTANPITAVRLISDLNSQYESIDFL